ncbi:MAG: V-type ATP synthase subunit D [Corallococcus sp.]|nr:V-type ATP synthase subunit D [Corallococcus sp.]
MAVMNVNPTRMELKRLTARLKTASRGHKLLKDKTDEMVRRFVVLARENKRLRQEVESDLASALRSFAQAATMDDGRVTEEAVLMPSASLQLKCSKKSFMNVSVPKIEVSRKENGDVYPYSFLTVSQKLDESVETVNKLIDRLVQLAEVEKTCNMLADEIEKNKRRVNALENIMIPQMEETIKFIKMKLDENERASTVRLMKVKDIIQKQQ